MDKVFAGPTRGIEAGNVEQAKNRFIMAAALRDERKRSLARAELVLSAATDLLIELLEA